MSRELKIILRLTVVFLGFALTSADIKILIPLEDSFRNETISLDSDQHLLVKGTFEQYFKIPNISRNRLHLAVVYTADKDGYKAKYVLMKKIYFKPMIFLSPATLKSTAG